MSSAEPAEVEAEAFAGATMRGLRGERECIR